MRTLVALSVLALVAGPALAAPVVNGSRTGDPYQLNVLQTVQTQFGDNDGINGGSEQDAAWTRIEGGRLYVMLTGNIEDNFNKLDVFIDSKSFGQNEITNVTNPTNDNWANAYNGFTFDTGFAADFMMIFRRGNDGTDKFDVDFAKVGGGDNDYVFYDHAFGPNDKEGSGVLVPGSQTGGTLLLNENIEVGYDNSNVAGILGGTGAADQVAAEAVDTGLEFSVALSDIGNPANPEDIKISVQQNGGGHDYLSNQFLGGMPAGTGNLGGDGAGNYTGDVGQIDLNDFAGNQYFVVPEPASLALLALGGVALLRRRR